eukprot:CAMPEP_0119266232 /NCGR_PEP_ID=MMETSP1329-20130426/4788_1 /TAXON_ID=114041 /ORGANISM="Genus nov. species nov., Strain RCC1024" /LENGTH=342 /DNA_ID=CAMNT_0007266101 /DNA_START=140 /DNA_END=1164 /DNA_ORIENTATION=-
MAPPKLCDALVHLNCLLPCFVVWWTLGVLKNVYAAVLCYELVLALGPVATLKLREPAAEAAKARAAVARLVQSLTKPHEWRRCTLVTTGTLMVLGFGCFAVYLAAFQKGLEYLGVVAAIKDASFARGLAPLSVGRDILLVLLGLWFCTVNPVLEELYWRGYAYAELGRILDQRAERETLLEAAPASEDSDDEKPGARARRLKRSLLDSEGQTWRSRWLSSIYFGAFHAVVVQIFVGPGPAFLVWGALALAGRVWIWLGERAPFGFPFVVAMHAGCDVAVVLVVSACDFGWTHHQGYFIALVACGALAVAGSGLLAAAWRHERFPDLPCAKDDAVPDDPPAEA